MTEICQKCHVRPATETWVADGSILTVLHGGGQRWCRVCTLTEQLKYARNLAGQIPLMERQLSEALALPPLDFSLWTTASFGSTGGHYKIICKYCQGVISQCRCPGPKHTEWGVCVNCEPHHPPRI